MNSEEVLERTPPEIRTAEMNELLPAKSRQIYEKQYARFEDWRKENKIFMLSEDILLAYFELQRQKYKSSSLWCLYSQLRSCFSIYKKVDISVYHKLQVFLKRCSEGYAPKKSKILKESEIKKFISEADDMSYMAMKVILIVGYSGACRREELTYMSTDDIKYDQDSITVSIPKTKNNLSRQFVITEEIWINLIRNYAALRPKNITHKRFFLTFRKGRCVNNPIGINTMGKVSKEIATFLKLPQPELYTGHCFRRSSATQLANCGGSKSSTVAEGNVEATLKKKIEITQTFKSQDADLNLPSSSISELHTELNLPSSSISELHTELNLPSSSISEPHTELNLPSCSSISEPNSRTNTTAIGCKKNTATDRDVSFHRFPKDEKTRQKWISRVNRSGIKRKSPWTPTKWDVICGKHFNKNGKRKYEDKFPRLFLHKTNPTKPKSNSHNLNSRRTITPLKTDIECTQTDVSNPVFASLGSEHCYGYLDESSAMDSAIPQNMSDKTFDADLDLDQFDTDDSYQSSSNSLENVQSDHTYSLPFTEHRQCASTIIGLKSEITKLYETLESHFKSYLKEKEDIIASQRKEITKLNSQVTFYQTMTYLKR